MKKQVQWREENGFSNAMHRIAQILALNLLCWQHKKLPHPQAFREYLAVVEFISWTKEVSGDC